MSLALSPIYSLGCGFAFMCVIILTFYFTGFYSDSNYFSWGPPVVFFDHTIRSESTFYLLLAVVFVHQLITNWIYEVIYPWIINTIQNPIQTTLNRNKSTCLAVVNFNSLYNQIHLAFIVNGLTSQISFLVALIVADFITLSYINWYYIKDKTVEGETEEFETEQEVEMTE